jgi:hypothetical protein
MPQRPDFRFAAAALAVMLLPGLSAGAQAQGATIRIEPRPFYGATVTLEEGVRVFRPLPSDRYVIINPDNRTPLNLSLSETRVYEQSDVHVYDHGGGRGGPYVSGGGGWPLYGMARRSWHGKPKKPARGF